MKQFTGPIAIIIIAVILLGKVTLNTVNATNASKEARATIEHNIMLKKQSFQVKTIQLQAKAGSNNPEEVVNTYGPIIKKMIDLSQVTQQVNKEAEELLIPIQEQKTSSLSLEDGTNAHIYSVTILSTFQDDLNWLGQIEDVYPFARVKEVTFEPSGDLVTLKTTLQFPIINL